MRLFCDSSSLYEMKSVMDRVYGYTTNPSLLRQAGVSEYEEFICQAVAAFPQHSLSFEVIADEPAAIRYQAKKLAKYGANIFVKVPAMLTTGESTAPLVSDLTSDGMHINVTAIMTAPQVCEFSAAIANKAECYLSIFAGRIADAGQDPSFLVRQARMEAAENVQILWASAREVFNVKHARDCGADIITLSPQLLAKYENFGRDLHEFSRETVQMFYRDAQVAGLSL